MIIIQWLRIVQADGEASKGCKGSKKLFRSVWVIRQKQINTETPATEKRARQQVDRDSNALRENEPQITEETAMDTGILEARESMTKARHDRLISCLPTLGRRRERKP